MLEGNEKKQTYGRLTQCSLANAPFLSHQISSDWPMFWLRHLEKMLIKFMLRNAHRQARSQSMLSCIFPVFWLSLTGDIFVFW
jgi:hypothetical protein